MAIRVELFGLARQRAGVSDLALELPPNEQTLGGVLTAVSQHLPALAVELLKDGRLHSALAANLDGQRFINDPATPVCNGQSLLILSADAGG